MELLIFLVILFGLFGIVSSQYMGQYREGYAIWVKEIVYNKSKNGESTEICSKIESLSRELCWIYDLLCGLILMIVFTFIVIICTLYAIFPMIDKPDERFVYISCSTLTVMIFFAVPIILKFILNIDIVFTSRTSGIDRKLFFVWCKHKCFETKNANYKTQLEPHRLYELLYELLSKKVESEKRIDCSEELFDLLNKKYGKAVTTPS